MVVLKMLGGEPCDGLWYGLCGHGRRKINLCIYINEYIIIAINHCE